MAPKKSTLFKHKEALYLLNFVKSSDMPESFQQRVNLRIASLSSFLTKIEFSFYNKLNSTKIEFTPFYQIGVTKNQGCQEKIKQRYDKK